VPKEHGIGFNSRKKDLNKTLTLSTYSGYM